MSVAVKEEEKSPVVDKSESRVRQMFGEIAGRYDFLNHLLSAGVDYYWRWYTVRKCPPQGTAPILDVCTGTGDLALSYWKAGRGKIAVTGTDFTPEMLVLARNKHTQMSAKFADSAAVRFLEADTQHLPFDENQFQLVTVAFGLRNVTDTTQGLREMIRVCQPGGRVVILEFSLPTNSLLRWGYQTYFLHVLPRIGQFFARNRQDAYNYLPASVSQFPHGEQLADLMRQSGLTDVRFQPLTFGIATVYWGVKPS